mmetsp:Transcript_29327/g.44754  ORF Transcript_29327/g.44754 Transcript_29327/m.44754 type:complete len:339 (-) Transcript_29327:37-1053(-)|eukprot:CAMPEP_0194210860 /NCGR_PEP_ID=MMETSP0156-20130528/9151_1 /TAXON_ID=33649 /ORGANISM="Thalassionema nitzschioides, Strain L26-B" /LENGTH=338 /DNA_ID=CAMNT_0038938271 /DNA_START=218 /DNA_END=1234 /DNA_ORIENTATION=+
MTTKDDHKEQNSSSSESKKANTQAAASKLFGTRGPAEIENLPEALTDSAREIYKAALEQQLSEEEDESVDITDMSEVDMGSNEKEYQVNKEQAASASALKESRLHQTGLLDMMESQSQSTPGLFDEVDREMEERRLKEEDEAEQKRREARKVLGTAFEGYDTTQVREDFDQSSSSMIDPDKSPEMDLVQMSKPRSFRNFFRHNAIVPKNKSTNKIEKPKVSFTDQLRERSKLKTQQEQGKDTLAFQMKRSLEFSSSDARCRRKWTIFFLILFLCATLTVLVIILAKETVVHAQSSSSKSIVATPDYIVPVEDDETTVVVVEDATLDDPSVRRRLRFIN